MLPDRVSNPGPLTYESGALPIALRGPASILKMFAQKQTTHLAFLEKKNHCVCPTNEKATVY